MDGQIFNIPSFIFYCTMKPNTCVPMHKKRWFSTFFLNTRTFLKLYMRHDNGSHDPHRKLQGFPNLMNDRLPERETGICRFHLSVEQFLTFGGVGVGI